VARKHAARWEEVVGNSDRPPGTRHGWARLEGIGAKRCERRVGETHDLETAKATAADMSTFALQHVNINDIGASP
jgi:hypothetical protein